MSNEKRPRNPLHTTSLKDRRYREDKILDYTLSDVETSYKPRRHIDRDEQTGLKRDGLLGALENALRLDDLDSLRTMLNANFPIDREVADGDKSRVLRQACIAAIKQGKIEAVIALEEHGANVHRVTGYGTAVDLAEEFGHRDIADFYKRKAAEFAAQQKEKSATKRVDDRASSKTEILK